MTAAWAPVGPTGPSQPPPMPDPVPPPRPAVSWAAVGLAAAVPPYSDDLKS